MNSGHYKFELAILTRVDAESKNHKENLFCYPKMIGVTLSDAYPYIEEHVNFVQQ